MKTNENSRSRSAFVTELLELGSEWNRIHIQKGQRKTSTDTWHRSNQVHSGLREAGMECQQPDQSDFQWWLTDLHQPTVWSCPNESRGRLSEDCSSLVEFIPQRIQRSNKVLIAILIPLLELRNMLLINKCNSLLIWGLFVQLLNNNCFISFLLFVYLSWSKTDLSVVLQFSGIDLTSPSLQK